MNIPQHVAIIMDGNGRWAKKQNKPRAYGHLTGTDNVRNIAIKADELGIKVLTLYAFSTENWKRPKEEIDYLMSLPEVFIDKFLKELMERNIKIETIGDLSALPVKTVKVLNTAINKTKKNKGMILVFALNYGGRSDIVNAVNSIIKNGNVNSITEQDINNHISTKDYPEVDLMIRTSLDYRISNFLLWQLSYAEFIFVDCYWPDFNGERFAEAIAEYTNRQRRFGGLL
ncbi:MAG: isoprenyl transferase [Bacillota bacterium]|jgi:undecaprenyl diphosphate synthase|nr:isoprenyl transferase [Bacillota bacterium]NLL25874.1 isoprenyl transferase [Erysipelotrichia bacterium]